MVHVAPTPKTPLDGLRAFLLSLVSGVQLDAGPLAGMVQAAGRASLRDLEACLVTPGTPRSVKKAICALPVRLDWMEWSDVFERALRVESDLGAFDDLAAALGGLGTRPALEALQRLQEHRREGDRQVILGREMGFFQVAHPSSHYLARLAEGQGNPRLSQQAARVLAGMAVPHDLPGLEEALRSGDDSVQRHALRIIGGMPGQEADAWLMSFLGGLHDELLDGLALEAMLARLAALNRTGGKEAVLRLAMERFGDRDRETCVRIAQAVEQEDPQAAQLVDLLRSHAEGACDTFLVEAMALLLDGKIARYNAHHTETSDTLDTRLAQIQVHAALAAEHLAYRVARGMVPWEQVGPILRKGFKVRLGMDGLMAAYLALVPATDAEALEEVLTEDDHQRRQKAYQALGAREEDALVPFFLKAIQDPIIEVGQLASHHLAKLPGSFAALKALFDSGQVEAMRRAIRVFGENRMEAAADLLLTFVQQDGRDDLLVETAEALVDLRLAHAVSIYLDLLHDGKPLALQIALVRALGALRLSEASLGLLQKATVLRQSEVLHLCLEGVLAAFPDFHHPFPEAHVQALMTLVERCWDPREGGEGQRLRTITVLEGLYTFSRHVYDTLKDRFADQLFAMRTQENWDRESNDRVAAAGKEMGRRSDNLGQLARRETELRSRLAGLPAGGSTRNEHLRAIKEILSDPELILRPEMGREIGMAMVGLLKEKAPDWRETALICEVAGLSHCEAVVTPVRRIFQRAAGVGLKSAARQALANLGLTPEDMERRPPVQDILILEPSAFFRRRLVQGLAEGARWTLREAGSRDEAAQMLEAKATDLLISEASDAAGDLAEWLEAMWEAGRMEGLLLSTSSRDAAERCGGGKLVGTLFKPYPLEALVDILVK